MDRKKKLYKSTTDVKICGVCGGIAEYFGWDAQIVRIVTVVVSIIWGAGLLAYIAAALILDDKPDDSVVDARPEDIRDID